MRSLFAKFALDLLKKDEHSIVLLGDISVGLFLNDSKKSLVDRVLNMGIAEQSMVSFAAGLSRENMTVIVHTISPFMIERAYEQIKLDISYNQNKVILVSANGPYEYSKLGPTHHCSSDIPLISLLPNLLSALPGRLTDVDPVLNWALRQTQSVYVRLTAHTSSDQNLLAGQILQKSFHQISKKLSIFVGEALIQYDELNRHRDSDILYIWSANQINIEELNYYDEIEVWEPYSMGIIATMISCSTPKNLTIYSHVYPQSIESGIYEKPFYISKVVK